MIRNVYLHMHCILLDISYKVMQNISTICSGLEQAVYDVYKAL